MRKGFFQGFETAKALFLAGLFSVWWLRVQDSNLG
jgi:hypothetical protein